jgi:hypothetical protein
VKRVARNKQAIILDYFPPLLANQLGAHPAFYTRSIGASFPKGKATGVHSYPLTPLVPEFKKELS